MTDPNLELQESGWEELRREARKIEGDLDVKLSSYAKLGARFTTQGGGYVEGGSPTVGSSRSWKSMEMEIQSSLEKLLDINDAMSRCAAASAATSVTQKLARHRDILHEFTQEFRRIKGNINSMREHAELLSSVRDDISEYKASGSMSPRVQLLRERAAIHGSIAHIDDVINQAQTTRAVLGSQRTLFGDVQGKVKLLSDKFPIIRGLLGWIKLCMHACGTITPSFCPCLDYIETSSSWIFPAHQPHIEILPDGTRECQTCLLLYSFLDMEFSISSLFVTVLMSEAILSNAALD
ncbi:hypothetical protein D5086_004860 [Populus alba]|uniref:Uncharacterized protein n=1 Tax=Populus alba TaxID=43335 RepID=A0ACC4CSY0_POPAL